MAEHLIGTGRLAEAGPLASEGWLDRGLASCGSLAGAYPDSASPACGHAGCSIGGPPLLFPDRSVTASMAPRCRAGSISGPWMR